MELNSTKRNAELDARHSHRYTGGTVKMGSAPWCVAFGRDDKDVELS